MRCDDGLCEFSGADFLLADALVIDVIGVDAIFNGTQPGVVDERGDVRLVDVDEHHDGAEQEAGWIGQVLPGAARRGAMNGLEHGKMIADIGRAGQANRTGDLGGHVGENIAVEVGQHDHIEGFGCVGHFGRTDIDDPRLVLDIGIFRGDLIEDAVEETIGQLHDVVLHEAGDLLAIVAACILEGVANDLFAAGAADQLEALHHIVCLAILDAGIKVFFVLTHDHHVHIWVLGV